MATVLSRPRIEPGAHILLHEVDWRTYSLFLRMFAERPRVRLTYDGGDLEIMSPLYEHDFGSRFLAFLVCASAEELGLTLIAGGTTTLRHKLEDCGLEPDECFWIANAPRLAGKLRLDLRSDPPPDLAIEVDVTRSSLDRMAIYAKLGVPEVWRLRKGNLTFHRLVGKGKYLRAAASRAIPGLTPKVVRTFLQKVQAAGDMTAVLREYRAFLRETRKL